MGLRAGSSKIRSLIATGRDNRRPNVINQYKRESDFIDYNDPTTQKIVAVFGVVKENDNNYVALKISCSTGYTVNWGDGTTENFGNGVRANHQYSWEDFSASDEITLDGITYRQAKVVITAQSSGQITFFDFQERHDDIGALQYNCSWLEITANTPYVTNLENSIGGTTVLLYSLQSVNIISVAASCTHADQLFYDCRFLKKVEFGFDTSQIIDWRAAFLNCLLIEDLENVDFSGAAESNGIQSLFQTCLNLKRVPSSFYEIDFANTGINSLYQTFYNCSSIDKIELFDTSKITNWYQFCAYSRRLLYLPKFDMSSATSFYRAFQYCYSLREIPEWEDTSNVTNWREAFRGCEQVTTIPNLDTSSGTNFYYTFAEMHTLQSTPSLDLTSATDLRGLFHYCYSIEHIEMQWPTYYTGGMDNFAMYCQTLKTIANIPSTWMPNSFNYCFYNDYMLQEIPDIDGRRVNTRYGYYHTFYNCDSIKTIPESIFYGLSNTGNTDWYRTFYSATSLEVLPNSLMTQISSTTLIRCREMFRYAISLRVAPPLTLSSSIGSDTNQINLFDNCYSLTKAPVTGSVYNLSFYNCFLQRDAIVEIFNGLGNASKTIDIRYNPGLSDLTSSDRAIATDKGWTITE